LLSCYYIRHATLLGTPCQLGSQELRRRGQPEHLRVKGLHSAIRLNEVDTQKKSKNKHVWLALRATAEYRQGTKERYRIGRKFGQARQRHEFGRCRYPGHSVMPSRPF
jgi:hypothetical protein